MNINKIKEIIADEPNFRTKQVYEAVFQKFIDSWDEASNLPKPLRETLEKEASLDIDAQVIQAENKKSAKALINLGDTKIEAVLMRHKDNRNTVCVSSQAGCRLACDFCMTGKGEFSRDLTFYEIIEQVLFFSRYLKKTDEQVTNVVFMGMGEPFNNYEEVMKAVRFLNDPETFNIGARRISISTVGVVDGINKLAADSLQVNLAVSLHASNDKLRSKIMPVNKIYPLGKLLDSIASYIRKTNRKVMIEYVMLAGVNDAEENAKELAKVLKNKLEQLFVINLISYNSTIKNYKSSSPETINKFKRILERERIEVVQRYKFGRDIKGACGQLLNN